MPVFLEIFFAKIVDTQLLYSKVLFEITTINKDPSEIVLFIIQNGIKGVPIFTNNIFLSHSTSWRYSTRGLIISYLVYSDFALIDKSVENKFSISEFKIVKATNAKNPSPKAVSDHNVLSHAIRHLAFLITHGEMSIYKEAINKENQKILISLLPLLAGKFE